MLCAPHGYVVIDIELFLSANVFKYSPLGVSGPTNKVFPKPEVKIDILALDIAFKLD